MPLSPGRLSFGTAPGDCVNICGGYHFSLRLSISLTGLRTRTGQAEERTDGRTKCKGGGGEICAT